MAHGRGVGDEADADGERVPGTVIVVAVGAQEQLAGEPELALEFLEGGRPGREVPASLDEACSRRRVGRPVCRQPVTKSAREGERNGEEQSGGGRRKKRSFDAIRPSYVCLLVHTPVYRAPFLSFPEIPIPRRDK